MADQAIACMGELGACAAGAGAYAFPFAHVMPQPSYQQALEALIEGAADRALIPAYNTRTGAMPDALGLLARSDFEIVGEVWRVIELHVLVPRDWVKAHHPHYFDSMSVSDRSRARAGLLALVSEIYADQAAFNQYSGFLKRVVPRAARHVTGCTGEAARLVHQSYRSADKPERYPPYAALASREAATMYGLVSLTGTLEPDEVPGDDAPPKRAHAPAPINDNWTLFYIVEHRRHAKQERTRTRWDLFTSLYGEARIRKWLSDADLEALFQASPELKGLLPDIETGQPGDGHAAKRDYDLAKTLFDTARDKKREPGWLVTRARGSGVSPGAAEAAEKEAAAARKQCERWRPGGDGHAGPSLRGAKDVKSVLVLRARQGDPDGQRLLAALYGGKADASVRMVATLPAPTDGKAGAGFIVEIDGYLSGLDGSRGFFMGGSTPAERLLGRVAAKADVHILGSLPRAAYPLTSPAKVREETFDDDRRWLRFAALLPLAILIGGAVYFFAR